MTSLRCLARALALLALLLQSATTSAQFVDAPGAAGPDATDTPDAPDDNPNRKGTFTTTFTRRTPAASLTQVLARWDASRQRDEAGVDYDIRSMQFTVHVPESFQPGRRFGLVVWLDPTGTQAAPPEGYDQLLADANLLWVSPHGFGTLPQWHQYGLPIDAVYNMNRRYRIDMRRVFIAGVGDGGRLAHRIAIGTPDLFAGVIASGDLDFFRRVDYPSNAFIRHPEAFAPPQGQHLARAKRSTRFVVFVNPNDSPDTRYRAILINGYREVGIKNLQTIETNMVGVIHNPDEFAAALALVDGKRPPAPRPAPPPAAPSSP